MAEHSAIEWTHHTFNPWWGCVRVSEACRFCYAEAFAKRVGQPVWGPRAPRKFFGDSHWAEPLKWNRKAAEAGERHRVFCASMADVFEERDELAPHRERLWRLIEQTPHLDWLLLTKRPWSAWPEHVWLGTTVEHQEAAERRIPLLLEEPAVLAFLSCEPLLGALELRSLGPARLDALRPLDGISWVIAGGESGPRARAMGPEWARSLRDQCVSAGVPFLFKQWGEWAPATQHPQEEAMERLGKHRSGRLLAGRLWDELPTAPASL